MTLIYKIEDQTIWKNACSEGLYHGSPDDQKDGFIHFSTADQLKGTLEKHYAQRKNLLLIAFKATILGDSLKWEPSRGGQLFPHLYGALPTTHILWEKPLEQNEDGTHIIPSDIK